MSPQTTTPLRVSRVIKADRERVFRAWTDPTVMKEWFCPEGFTVAEVSADATVGGRYRVQMRNPEGDIHTAGGVYRKVERPTRLVCTWAWEGEGMFNGETVLTVELKDLGDATEIILTHEGLPDEESKGKHEHGWVSCFANLEKAMAR